MGFLMHNQVISISSGPYSGIHRVVLDIVAENQTILVRLDTPSDALPRRSGRPRNDHSKIKKTQNRSFTELVWVKREVLIDLYNDNLLRPVEVEPDVIFLSPIINEKQQNIFVKRLKVMQGFLDFDNLKHRLLFDRNLGGLVKQAKESGDISTTQVYQLFTVLCRHGFAESSLRPRFDRCGAPGKLRPCDPDGRKKPGARTIREKIEIAAGAQVTPSQPGISTEWKNRILAADVGIKCPKPPMPTRCKLIINSEFVTRLKNIDGKLMPVHPELGKYPNHQQIMRVLKTNFSAIEQIKHKTTNNHFIANKRGLMGRNWEGVSGPGHTWAIDSTVGDIYLVSSVNRSWIVGRPIIYVIVDVWSSAIVGFYVCLSGPSWDMAKIALFCASADSHLIAQLFGYQPMFIFDPLPTMPAIMLCDRGEYLSLGASYTGSKLTLNLSYAPPFRADLKGVVEVAHRIEKDQQYHFVPGAIDARRKEYELRKFDRKTAVLTAREYTHYLYAVFSEYNLTANREHRLDAHMRATDVIPTPAGLWNWGHKVGIGVQRAKPTSELITTLLPTANATVNKHGVKFAGKHYVSSPAKDQEWAEEARNLGGWDIQGHYFPGSVSKIWIPNEGGKGMLEMQLSDFSTSVPDLTFDEYADALAYSQLNKQKLAHQKSVQAIQFLAKKDEIIQQGKRLTADAASQPCSPQPAIKFTRAIEDQIKVPLLSYRKTAPSLPPPVSQENESYTRVMNEILNAQNRKDGTDEDQ